MVALRIYLFGKFEMQQDALKIREFEHSKARELFFYLLLNPERPHLRETLIDILWKDYPGDQARKYFRQTLWQAQALLEKQTGLKNLFVVEREYTSLNPDVELWIDANELKAAFHRASDQRGLSDEESEWLNIAANLYRGDLLEGWYQDWCLFERERYQRMYLTILTRLVAECEQRREYETGILYAQRILRLDSAHERTHRHLMWLYYLTGDRTEALRQFERCVTALKYELDVEPTRKTRKLYEQIRADILDEPTKKPAEGAAPMTEVLHHLSELKRMVSELQRQVRKQQLDSAEDT